jgi:ABC-type antimicrobial peptide transport system permease subunit
VVESATWGSGATRPTVYRGWGDRPVSNAVLLVGSSDRTAVGVGGLLGTLRPLGVALDPFETLDGLLIRSRVLEVFLMRLATGFGLLALLVAVGAIHAHFVRWVRTRARDMAIRLALGAPFPAIGRGLVLTALMTVVPGLVLGSLLGSAASRAIGQVLGPMPAISIVLLAMVSGTVLMLTGLALTGPLIGARRVEPLSLLRGD